MMSPQPASLTSRRSRMSRSSRAGERDAEGTVKTRAVDAARKSVQNVRDELKCIASCD